MCESDSCDDTHCLRSFWERFFTSLGIFVVLVHPGPSPTVFVPSRAMQSVLETSSRIIERLHAVRKNEKDQINGKPLRLKT